MSKIFKKKITHTFEIDYIKCDKCGIETPFAGAIDVWAIHDDENYCYECQKKHKIGYGEKSKK